MPVDIIFNFEIDVPCCLDEFSKPVLGFQTQCIFGGALRFIGFRRIETNKPVAVIAMVDRIAVNDKHVSGGHPQCRIPMPVQIFKQRCTE